MIGKWYRRKNSETGVVRAKKLTRFKIIFSKSGIFWGRRGDWLVRHPVSLCYWIVEGSVFDELYEVEKGGHIEP